MIFQCLSLSLMSLATPASTTSGSLADLFFTVSIINCRKMTNFPSSFESWFNARNMDESKDEDDSIMEQEQKDSIVSTLHQILMPFLLKRVRADVDLKIPPKKE